MAARLRLSVARSRPIQFIPADCVAVGVADRAAMAPTLNPAGNIPEDSRRLVRGAVIKRRIVGCKFNPKHGLNLPARFKGVGNVPKLAQRVRLFAPRHGRVVVGANQIGVHRAFLDRPACAGPGNNPVA